MKLSNFELVLELREYIRDQAVTSYVTNYSLETKDGVKVNDFTEIKEIGGTSGKEAGGNPSLTMRRGKR